MPGHARNPRLRCIDVLDGGERAMEFFLSFNFKLETRLFSP